MDGEKVAGRIYRMTSVATERWLWAARRYDVKPNNGVAPTREGAMQAFKAAWIKSDGKESETGGR
jgi:hypothetical protein